MSLWGVAYPQPYLEPEFNAAHFPPRSQASTGLQSVNLANVVCQTLTCSGTAEISSLKVTGAVDFGLQTLTVPNLIDSGLTASKLIETDSKQQLVSSSLTSSDATALHGALTGSSLTAATSGTLTTGALVATSLRDTGFNSAKVVESDTSGNLVSSALTSSDATALHAGLTGGSIAFATSGSFSTGIVSASKVSATQLISPNFLTPTVIVSDTMSILQSSSLTATEAGNLHSALTGSGLSMCTSGTLSTGYVNVSGGLDAIYVSNPQTGPANISIHASAVPASAFVLGLATQNTNFSDDSKAGDIVLRNNAPDKQVIIQSGQHGAALVIDSSNNVTAKQNFTCSNTIGCNQLNSGSSINGITMTATGTVGNGSNLVTVGGTHYTNTNLVVSNSVNTVRLASTTANDSYATHVTAGDSVLSSTNTPLVLAGNGIGAIRMDNAGDTTIFGYVNPTGSSGNLSNSCSQYWENMFFKGTLATYTYFIPLASTTNLDMAISVDGTCSVWDDNGIYCQRWNFIYGPPGNSSPAKRIYGTSTTSTSFNTDFAFSTSGGTTTLYIVLNKSGYATLPQVQPNLRIRSNPSMYFQNSIQSAWTLVQAPINQGFSAYSLNALYSVPSPSYVSDNTTH